MTVCENFACAYECPFPCFDCSLYVCALCCYYDNDLKMCDLEIP